MSTKIIMFLGLCMALCLPTHLQADYIAPELPLTPRQMLVKQARVYAVPEKELVSTAKCESGFNPKSHNKTDPNGGSKGIMNFQPATFYAYAKKAGIKNPDIWNPEHNAITGAYMFSIGEAKQWTTWMAIKNGGSYTFFYKPLNKKITIYCKLMKEYT